MNASTIPDFTVTGSTPAEAKIGVSEKATVTGKKLDAGKNCQRLVYLFRQTFSDTGSLSSFVPVNITSVKAQELEGNFKVMAGFELGEYHVKVFIGDKGATSPNTVTVKP